VNCSYGTDKSESSFDIIKPSYSSSSDLSGELFYFRPVRVFAAAETAARSFLIRFKTVSHSIH